MAPRWSPAKTPRPACRRLRSSGCSSPPSERRRDAGVPTRSHPTRSPRSCSPRADRAQPKGVINTHKMMCSNQQALRQPLAVSGAPIHRRCSKGCPGTTPSCAGTAAPTCLCCNGPTTTSTRACPRQQLIAPTLRNLREISTSVYFNVPAGFEALLPHLGAAMCSCAPRSSGGCACSTMQPLRCRRRPGTDSSAWRARRPGVRSRSSAAGARPRPRRCRRRPPDPARFAGAIGVPAPGTEIKLSPKRRQARSAGARSQRHAWLLEAARAHPGLLRSGRLLSHG